jgi:hypothetical protein
MLIFEVFIFAKDRWESMYSIIGILKVQCPDGMSEGFFHRLLYSSLPQRPIRKGAVSSLPTCHIFYSKKNHWLKAKELPETVPEFIFEFLITHISH